jgi:pimeloyl-ACP methyl ester carboxylesterase
MSTETVLLTGAGVSLVATAYGPPDGRTVVMLHGGGQTRHSWAATAHRMATQGWRSLAIDLRGHGDSDRAPDADYRTTTFGADVAAVVRQLDVPVVLLGASLGGLAGLLAVASGDVDAVEGLVMVDVAATLETRGVDRVRSFMISHAYGFDSLEEVAEALAAFNPDRARPANLEGLRRNVRRGEDGRWYWHWDPAFMWHTDPGTGVVSVRQTLDPAVLEAAARAVHVPTLLVRGRRSDMLSEDGARELLACLPNATYADVAGAGHTVAGDDNDPFADVVARFVAGLPGWGRSSSS